MLPNDTVVCLLGLGVLLFATTNRAALAGLPAWRLLAGSLMLMVLGWLLAVVQDIGGVGLLGPIEHSCHASSSVLMAAWCWESSRHRVGEEGGLGPHA
jgi:hypothetical protein